MTTKMPGVAGSLVIVEPNHEGHRFRYVAQIASAFRAASPTGSVHFISTPEGIRSEEYAEHISANGIDLVVHPMTGNPNQFLMKAQELAQEGPTRIALPDGEKFLVPTLRTAFARRKRDVSVGLLVMRTDSLSGGIKILSKQLAKRACAALVSQLKAVDAFFLTDSFGVVESRAGYRTLRPLKDPEPDRVGRSAEGFESWNPERDKVISIIGRVTARKNPHLLINYAKHAPEFEVVLAGKIDVDLSDDIASASNVTVIDRLLTSNELNYIAERSNIVFTVYDNDAPSGILATAVRCGTPVIVRRGTWLEKVVHTLGIGESIDTDVSSIELAADKIISQYSKYVDNCVRARDLLTVEEFTTGMLGRASTKSG